jgi:hypothetical protein
MALRHIVVEGPDGSGKTNMVNRLHETFGFPIHTRASRSTTGPLERVDLWAAHDVDTMADQPPSVYDRHPVISEPIYASLARNEMPHGSFIDPVWRKTMRANMAPHALLIICMPPLTVVEKNVMETSDNQMPGVLRNITAIYHAYRQAWDLWPGYARWWNYTTNHTGAGYERLAVDIIKMMAISAVGPVNML